MRPRRASWTEYSLEAFGLGLFMVSAAGFAVLLFHPESAAVGLVPDPLARRGLMGLAMALTAILNTYAPWGRRSGAHLNPAVTLAFFRLGKVTGRDLAGYLTGQFAGAVGGIAIASTLLGARLAHPAVNYVATVPGRWGAAPALAGELVMTFLLMGAVLHLMDHPRLARFTGVAAALLVGLYITIEAPLSGMSLNPARTTGSAVWAGPGMSLWIYFAGPVLGMLAAAELRVRVGRGPRCAKLLHDDRYRCPFCGAAD